MTSLMSNVMMSSFWSLACQRKCILYPLHGTRSIAKAYATNKQNEERCTFQYSAYKSYMIYSASTTQHCLVKKKMESGARQDAGYYYKDACIVQKKMKLERKFLHIPGLPDNLLDDIWMH